MMLINLCAETIKKNVFYTCICTLYFCGLSFVAVLPLLLAVVDIIRTSRAAVLLYRIIYFYFSCCCRRRTTSSIVYSAAAAPMNIYEKKGVDWFGALSLHSIVINFVPLGG